MTRHLFGIYRKDNGNLVYYGTGGIYPFQIRTNHINYCFCPPIDYFDGLVYIAPCQEVPTIETHPEYFI